METREHTQHEATLIGDDSAPVRHHRRWSGRPETPSRRRLRGSVLVTAGAFVVLVAAGGGIAAAAVTAPSTSPSVNGGGVAVTPGPSSGIQPSSSAQLPTTSATIGPNEPVTTAQSTYSPAQWAAIYHNRLNLATCMRAKGFTTFPLPTSNYNNGAGSSMNIRTPTEPKLHALPWKTAEADLNSCTSGNIPVPSA